MNSISWIIKFVFVFGAELATGRVISREGERDTWSWSLFVGNSGQTDTVVEPSYNKHNI